MTSQGVTVTCAQVAQNLATQQSGEITCKATSAGCDCSFGVKDVASNDTGTYTVAGGVRTDTAQNPDDSDVVDFCVKETTLTESPHAGTAGSDMTIMGTITLTKQ